MGIFLTYNLKAEQMSKDIFSKIEDFNRIFRTSEASTLKDLINFKDILDDEISEGEDLIAKIEDKFSSARPREDITLNIDERVELADWLGDVAYYCISQAVKWGLPLKEVMDIIHESNMSKLDDSGKPIVNEIGKIGKGPNYKKPEAAIKYFLLTGKYEGLK